MSIQLAGTLNAEPISLGVTAREIVDIALANIGTPWAVDGCAAFVWGVTNLAGLPFFDLENKTFNNDPTSPQDVEYIVPHSLGVKSGTADIPGDGWYLVSSSSSVADLVSVLRPGDVVRVYEAGNANEDSIDAIGHPIAHSFIVVSNVGDDVQVVDNWTGAISEHSLSKITNIWAPEGQFAAAFVSRIDTAWVTTNVPQNTLAGDAFGDWSVPIERVSVANDGTEANSGSGSTSISADGRYVAFDSQASNLVDGHGGPSNVYVFDRYTKTIEVVSVTPNGGQPTGTSGGAVISSDGRYVGFTGYSDDLVSNDTNRLLDAFIYDRVTHTTELVSVDNDGRQFQANSHLVAISADDRYAVFFQPFGGLFVHDRLDRTTEVIVGGNSVANGVSINADGRYIAFSSEVPLVAGDTNNAADIFVFDRDTQTLERIMGYDGSEPVNGGALSTAISADGRYVAFASSASNLVTGDGNNNYDVFVYDRITQTTERVSVASDGTEANDSSFVPSISADGRYVSFFSGASNLVAGDTNNDTDVFVYDRLTHTTQRVSITSDGTQTAGGPIQTQSARISADGKFVAFDSSSSNLVPGDTNGVSDIFVVDRTLIPSHQSPTVNHAPVVDTAHSIVSGSISEFLNVSSPALHIASGAIAFTDADINDRPTASVTHKTVVDAQGNPLHLSAAQLDAVKNAFLIVPDSGNTNNGKIDWGYTITDNALDFLGADQTAVLTSTIEIDDHRGGTADQDVTVTIHGASTVVNTDLLTGLKVALATDPQIAVEMIKLAVDAYPDPPSGSGASGYHLYNQLTLPEGTPPDSSAQIDIQRGWHAVSASELGLNSYNPQGSIQYSFAHGYYQAVSGDDKERLNSDPSEADALVLTGVIDGKRTLALSFAGTDQWSDWLDYADFASHYAKFAPLVSAIKSFIDASQIQQIFVSGHSLGAAMAQDFMEEFPGDPRFKAWTIGSPGSDDIQTGMPDSRITNFYHSLDPIFQVPIWVNEIVGELPFLSNVEYLALRQKLEDVLTTQLPDGDKFTADQAHTVTVQLLNNLMPKFHAGAAVEVPFNDAIIPSNVFQFPGGAQGDFDEHAQATYLSNGMDIAEYYATRKLADGYIASATVFADANGNGQLDPGEVSTTTNANGAFSLASASGQLIAFGGIDTSTGLAFRGQLAAPAGSAAITPLTTLVSSLQKQGMSSAEAQVLAATGLDPSIDLTTFDPIAAIANTPSATTVYSVGAEVMNTVTMIASALTSNGTPIAENTVEVFGALANVIATPGIEPINLADVSFVSQLVTTSAEALHHPVDAAFVSAVATVVAASNSALEQNSSQLSGQALIDAVSAVEKLAQGAESAALQSAAGDPSLLNIVANAFTGSNLTNAITPPSTGADHTPWLATDNVASHTITEIAGKTGSNDPDTASGKLLFTDADLSDTHQVSADLDQFSFNWMKADGSISSTPLPTDTFDALIHAAQAALISDSANGNIGEISWNFGASDHYFDFLAADETLSATYNIAVTDDHGATSVQPVAIVINGTNDHPAAVSDSNGVAKGSTLSVGASAGVLASDTDPDVHDHLVVSAVNGSDAGIGHAVKGTYGSLTLNADGSYAYTANKGALPSQIVAQDTFKYTVSDGHGGTQTSTLSIVEFNPDVNYLSGMNTTLTGAINSKNALDGSAGHDVLIGGNGADILIGGKGDTLTGGAGPDTFVFRPDFGTNVISDFNVVNEAIQIDKSIFATVNDVLAHTTDTSAGAAIADEHGDAITLAGVTLSQLQAHQSDFHLV